ncbi:SGNH hydrolase-type esterase domain-containing protein [Mycena rosella]|uniref:SGNH hydrolase-type esterase domain-containing protein n=1 Tax=Mycena rosella TaxID=1033263 RepID=A0AAD7GV61_MYCRO|nr:SGNH hydrolase-type esterase domain-containing protein [Mycena rosella]
MFTKVAVSLFLSLGACAQTVYTAGDSTMAAGGGGSGTDGWAQYLAQYLTIPVVNMAIAGRSARSYTDEGRFTTLINTVKSGDFVRISLIPAQIIEVYLLLPNRVGILSQFNPFSLATTKPISDGLSGTVDNGREDAFGDVYATTSTVTESDGSTEVIHTFTYYMQNAIVSLKAKGATVIVSSQTPDNIWVGTSIGPGPRFVLYAQEVAATNSVTYVDHYDYVAQAYDKLGETAVTAFFPIDHTHTLPAGAMIVAEAFVRGLLCGTSTLKAKVNGAGNAVPSSTGTGSPTTAGPPNPAGETPLAGQSSGNRNEQPPPHDRILGSLFEGQNSSEDGLNGSSRASVLDNKTIYDPFDGSVIGTLVAPDPNVIPEEHGKLTDTARNEELWSHLSRVLELQNQISRMHLDLEGIGMDARDPKGKGKGTRSRATSVTRVVIDDVEGEEGIGGKRDEEAEQNKAREEQFSNLSGQFRGKREAINGIMSELDSLAKAVTEMHALQAPKIDFLSSRNNSLPATNAAEPLAFANPAVGDMRSHINPAPTPNSQPPLPALKRADEPGIPQELVESPISTLITLPP